MKVMLKFFGGKNVIKEMGRSSFANYCGSEREFVARRKERKHEWVFALSLKILPGGYQLCKKDPFRRSEKIKKEIMMCDCGCNERKP